MKAEQLWGSPDDEGRYLVSVVEHGDDMSEDDYTALASTLLAAVTMAAREYGYDVDYRHSDQCYRLITDRWADPMVAQFADGTLIAVRSAARRGPGWRREIRRPTPREHARWAGLPVPPEPPSPEPTLVDVVWKRLTEHAGTVFTTSRGKEFTYEAFAGNLCVKKPNGAGTSLSRGMVHAALEVWPVVGPTSLPIGCGHGQRTYVWAVLSDRRILGLASSDEGKFSV